MGFAVVTCSMARFTAFLTAVRARSGALAIRGLASGLAPGKLEASNLQVQAALEPGLCGLAAALSLRLEGSEARCLAAAPEK